ncbi:MAG: 5-formyltetrahydrofolate cyclo-ligase [Fibrobacter sp.]|nr:5-formyltetrahydrofolate cyclo-ligase [Fibrobacter sp.]
MNAEIGFSEFGLLFLLALLLFNPKDLGKAVATFKYWKGKIYRLKFDLEDELLETQIPDKKKESAWIVQAIRNFEPYKSAKKVAAFYPLANEPDIRPILQDLAKEGRLLLPITYDGGIMDFVEIHDLQNDLVEGRFHVHEPKKELPIYHGAIPFVLTPGVEFSWDGGRHGHGKGYYDRFLKNHPDAIKCGVAFSTQVSPKPLILKPHDVPMNYIVAPKNDPEKETPHVEKATV